MTYKPQPINTQNVKLSEDLEALIHLLADNVHENWAAQRIKEGWRYGPRRDDRKKQHPCLLPFDKLPDGEKNYDIKTALETLKVIVSLNYRILPPGGGEKTEFRDIGETTVDDLRQAAASERRAGNSFRACDILYNALMKWPRDVRSRQLYALSLADVGAKGAPQTILQCGANTD